MAKTRNEPPSFDVREVFDYSDGNLLWKQPGRGRKIGAVVGSLMLNGYISLNVKGRYFYVHRLVYFFHTGRWPELIDHIDCNKSNNRIENLREVNKSQNGLNRKDLMPNNKSGFNGVYWSKAAKKWIAQSTLNRKTTYIGGFNEPVEAAKAIKEYLSTKETT
jgi:hypothetical protein